MPDYSVVRCVDLAHVTAGHVGHVRHLSTASLVREGNIDAGLSGIYEEPVSDCLVPFTDCPVPERHTHACDDPQM